jgi:hypothetical protein
MPDAAYREVTKNGNRLSQSLACVDDNCITRTREDQVTRTEPHIDEQHIHRFFTSVG